MLNIAQFLGVVNDNLFKFAMAYLLIDALGNEMASPILSATGAIYVIPFLIFSSSAGILADRFSKQRLLVIMKIAEMAIMALALLAFSKASIFGCYILLFLLSTHSALFGPSKYGIIPELVPSDRISRANGLITAFTYLAIILGTFLASFLTEITQRHFIFIALFCFLVALGGFLSALRIKKTQPQGAKKSINLLFVREIFDTLKLSKKIRHLLPAMLGSAFFLFIGGFTQLNIIPYGIKCLNLSEVAGGYLFLLTALGIALGSYLGGKASKKRIELGISCLAGIVMALFLMLLSICPSHLIKSVIALILIGVFGGIFIVPFDTFIQVNSPDAQRGQTIGATNFLSFLGVLIASLLLYIFPTLFHLSPAGGFGVMGLLTLLFSCMQMLLLSDLFLSYISRLFLQRLFKLLPPTPSEVEKIEKTAHAILVLEKATWRNALLLMGSFSKAHLLIPASHRKCIPWFHRLFYSFHVVYDESTLLSQAHSLLEKGDLPCLFLQNSFLTQQAPASNAFLDFFQKKPFQLIFVAFERDRMTSRLKMQISHEK
ncbi:MAG TPA: MFS transporter [Rhabdochlamydiaceae bacterium]